MASKLSQYPGVRAGLLGRQRNCYKPGQGLIAEGRDCGTVVFPDALAKFYLTARSDSRAARRAVEQGKNVDEVVAHQQERDRQDSSRKTSPLQIPENSEVVDTSDLNLEQVVAKVHESVQNRLKLS